MVTRFSVGTNRPTERLNLHVSLVSPLPKSYRDAFSDPNWQNAMRDEYHTLIKNKTWTLVPRPPDTNIVRCMWLFRHKYLADGTLSRYKARLVANGSTQLEGVDVDETFYDIPDIIPPTIPTNPAVQLPPEPITPIHNTENQAHSPPPSTSAVQQQTPTTTQSPATQNEHVAQSPIIIPDPPENPNPVSVHPMVTRFCVGTNRPTKRLNLHVSLVSPLPKSYRDAFSDPKWQNAMRDEYHALIKNKTWTLVSRPPDTNIRIISSLHQEFAMTDLGALNYFLGISVMRDSSGLFLSQKKYVVEILEKAHMVNCNPSRTPVDTESKLGVDGDPIYDIEEY
ncbi:ribonuclease H-like domain-containing protein [Tanacetum coccineum]